MVKVAQELRVYTAGGSSTVMMRTVVVVLVLGSLDYKSHIQKALAVAMVIEKAERFDSSPECMLGEPVVELRNQDLDCKQIVDCMIPAAIGIASSQNLEDCT